MFIFTLGLSTNTFGIKHLEFRVKGIFMGEFSVIGEHNVDRKLTNTLLIPNTWLVLTFPCLRRLLKSSLTPKLSSTSTGCFCFAESFNLIFERRRNEVTLLKVSFNKNDEVQLRMITSIDCAKTKPWDYPFQMSLRNCWES